MAGLQAVVEQLRQERERIQQELGRLESALAALEGASSTSDGDTLAVRSPGGPGYKRSPEVRARMAASQRARWATPKGQTSGNSKSASGGATGQGQRKRTMSADARARIAAAQRARWARTRQSQ